MTNSKMLHLNRKTSAGTSRKSLHNLYTLLNWNSNYMSMNQCAGAELSWSKFKVPVNSILVMLRPCLWTFNKLRWLIFLSPDKNYYMLCHRGARLFCEPWWVGPSNVLDYLGPHYLQLLKIMVIVFELDKALFYLKKNVCFITPCE